MMGSHASQLTPTQRWKIIMHVQTLQHVGEQTAAADSTAGKTKADTKAEKPKKGKK